MVYLYLAVDRHFYLTIQVYTREGIKKSDFTMNNSQQMHLHSENFDLCRICLLEPESNRNIKFLHVFLANSDTSQLISELLDVKVGRIFQNVL